MNQIQKIMDDGLNINWDNKTPEELQIMEEIFLDTFKQRKTTQPDDYYFSDQERKVLDTIRFFRTKKEHQEDQLKIGDIFHTSWGYDQTNTEYFQVVKISPTGKTCQVRQIGARTIKGTEGVMSESIYPDSSIVIVEESCQVKIERSTSWNPVTEKRESIGEYMLRGSVWYAQGHGKHLQSLYRTKGREYRSWYH